MSYFLISHNINIANKGSTLIGDFGARPVVYIDRTLICEPRNRRGEGIHGAFRLFAPNAKMTEKRPLYYCSHCNTWQHVNTIYCPKCKSVISGTTCMILPSPSMRKDAAPSRGSKHPVSCHYARKNWRIRNEDRQIRDALQYQAA